MTAVRDRSRGRGPGTREQVAGSFPASASQHGRWPPLPAPRYNDFLHDPLSLCRSCRPQPNGENAISARSDLNPANGSYPFQALSQRSHGGIDVKVRATPPPRRPRGLWVGVVSVRRGAEWQGRV